LRKDDGVGPRVIEELKARGLPEGVTALDGGTGGLDLLQVIEGWDDVVVVDAADVDAGTGQIAPGEFVRFTPEQARLRQSPHTFSLHHAGLAEVLALAHALDRTLPSIVVFGVQPRDVGWGEGLSPEIEARLPALVDAVLEQVNQGNHENHRHDE
jgi:hydrogenase maturation protease